MKKSMVGWQLLVLLMIVGVRYSDVMHGSGGVSGISFTFFITLVFGALFQNSLNYKKGYGVAFVYWFLVDLVFSVFVVRTITNMGLIPVL